MTKPSGTTPCAKNNTSLISCGVPSLDSIFGGGVALGSTVLIEEDCDRLYSSILVKCFLAEGILSEHSSCLLLAEERHEDFMKNLPAEAGSKNSTETKTDDASKLDIAWRYAKTTGVRHPTSASSCYFGHKLDISRSLEVASYLQSPLFHAMSYDNFLSCDSSDSVLESALEVVKTALASSPSLLRLVFPAFGSPAWGPPSSLQATSRPDLSRFLSRVRLLLRDKPAVAVVTVPSPILAECPGLRQRLCTLADYAFQLESFAASDKEANPVFKDYRGAFRVLKLPLLNATCPISRPETLDLAFKVRAQNFLIEPLCLPPDLSDSVSRSMTRGDARAGPGCGSGGRSVTDF